MNSARATIRTIGRVMEMTVKQTATDGFIIFTVLIQPILVAFLGLWMLRSKGAEYAIYVVVGSGMTGLWSSLLFVSGNAINIERWSGTLETLAGVPTSMATITFGKNLANVVQSLVSMVTAYVLVSAILGYPLAIAMPFYFVVSLLFTIVAFICFGLVIAPIFVLNPAIQQWQNGFEFPVYILSGFLFPVAMLPVWSVPVSYILPTFWAARALHMASRGTGTAAEITASWGVLVVVSVVCLALSGALFRVMIRKAKRDATLDYE